MTLETLPDWLTAARQISPGDVPRLQIILRSWITLFTEKKNLSEPVLAQLFWLEYTGKNRELILKKLKLWHTEARHRREVAQFPRRVYARPRFARDWD